MPVSIKINKASPKSLHYFKLAGQVCEACFEPINAVATDLINQGRSKDAVEMLQQFIAKQKDNEGEKKTGARSFKPCAKNSTKASKMVGKSKGHKIAALSVALVTFFIDSHLAGQSEDRFRSLETFSKALFYLETMYVDADKVTPSQNIENALDGLLMHLDPHTVRLPKKAFNQLTEDNQGKYGGIGIMVHQEGIKLMIVNPMAGSPAEKAGLRANDEILAIDGVELTALKEGEAVEKMKGPVGTTIRLKIRRAGTKDPIEYKVVRQVIEVKSVQGQTLDDSIGLVRLAHFQENTADNLNAWLKDKSLGGLILDLRDNPGGLLDQAVKVVDTFISSGLIVSTVGRDPDKIEREFATKSGSYTDFPLVVLINEGSASASEIVAGALQDHQRALLMGERSFGKGSVQTLVPLPDGSGLKFTIARYYTPNDRSIQAKGIIPDIFVPLKKENKDKEKIKRESDLTGHIEAQNLSKGSKDSIGDSITKWSPYLQQDYQVVTAYTYLKGFSIFAKTKPKA